MLANSPLSLVPDNFVENWSQRHTTGWGGCGGRVTLSGRTETFKWFLAMLRRRAAFEQQAEAVDKRMANTNARSGPGYTAATDRAAHGLNRHTYGRMTLYCNPHDQVISASTIQGIGWRGLSAAEIVVTEGQGVFTQRVFAQQNTVGKPPGIPYRYWDGGRTQAKRGFWHPPSPPVRFRLRQGLASATTDRDRGLTVTFAPALGTITAATSVMGLFRVNAEPDKDWEIPIDAPALPEPFVPLARRYGVDSDTFDEGYDPEGSARDRNKSDPDCGRDETYGTHRTQTTQDGRQTDAPMGNEETEAYLRYQHKARMRMQDRRGGAEQAAVPASRRIATFLNQGVNQVATDHSTIMTQPMHAEKALAYDVAIGICTLSETDWRELRVEADWRYAKVLEKGTHPSARYAVYFLTGNMDGTSLQGWVARGEASMPDGIHDGRGEFRDRGAI